jgi:2-polyprenyl-6-hydroxyphenyl methylase/3-demethylubiquinone-9 3-methyltransferase
MEPCSSVEEAIAVLEQLVASQAAGDEQYFRSQMERFRLTVRRLEQLSPKRMRILDVGSHYLHQASLLRLMGHEVIGIDVPLFSQAPFVVDRAHRLGITNLAISNLEDGEFLACGDYEGTIDLVIFTAVLEHITFNPVRLWRRIYELLSDRGVIYVTTPNGLRPAAVLRQLVRLLVGDGSGLPVDDILRTITYGHHWKEYSVRELHQYFRLLSPDFRVQARRYQDPAVRRGLRGLVSSIVASVPFGRDEIETVVSLCGKSGRFYPVPGLPMNTRRL